jgi:surfeit locus 1 family protein
MPRRRIHFFLLASLLGIAILTGLGVWQLERLQWKRALLADLDHAFRNATPVSLADAEASLMQDPAKDYVRVGLNGTFDHSGERFLFSSRDAVPGWHVLTPFVTSDRRLVLVDRGFIPERLKPPDERTQGQIAGKTKLEGFLRKARPPGLFTPANRPNENVWYWPDVPAILTSLAHRPELQPSNYVVQALPSQNSPAWPRAEAPNPAVIPNNHLQYALTWFALALILAVMSFMVFRNARESEMK